ncbi:MAG: hypothetical protein JNM18_14900 [Planctomycetaceae bacterium]|nr:hypothetical protein [Planctomycetaceae bacterium]
MKVFYRLFQLALLLACGFAPTLRHLAADEPRSPHTSLLLVIGAPGEDSYGKIFTEELALWRRVAQTSDVELTVIGDQPAATPSDKDRLQTALQRERDAKAQRPLWIVFIGHGTFDGRVAAFNLRGPDLSQVELAEWLKGCERPLAVINTTSASAPFLTALAAPGRVVITATKSGQERNYTRFGRYFAERVIDATADLDKDEQTSLLEAFLAAARDTSEFYKSDGRIMTEHPLLDDNGDGRGIRLDFFERDRLIKAPTGNQAADGDLARRWCLKPSSTERQLTAEQTAKRDQLEAELASLRRRKRDLPEDEYFAELERLLVELAKLYQP